MPAPTTAPIRVDSNGTRQSPGIPSAVQSDGFQEKQNVPNSWWNSIFKNWSDWLRYLAGAVGLLHAQYEEPGNDSISSGNGVETVVGTYTLPAGTIPATGTCRLRVSGIYHADDVSAAAYIRTRVRINPATLGAFSFIDATVVPAGAQSACKFELELILESDGGAGSLGSGTADVWLWDGTVGGWAHYPNDSGTNLATPVRYVPAAYDIAHLGANVVEVTTEWDDVTTGTPNGRLANFSVDFALLS